MLLFDTTNQSAYMRLDYPKAGDKLKVFKEHVGGNIEGLPHDLYGDAPFVAYANEEGMIKDLPSNFLAFGVLRQLGFLDSTAGLAFYFGNVLLVGKKGKALTEKAIKQVDIALAKYLKEME